MAGHSRSQNGVLPERLGSGVPIRNAPGILSGMAGTSPAMTRDKAF
jgi:hypothetical protein